MEDGSSRERGCLRRHRFSAEIDRQTTRSEKRRRGGPLFFRATVSKEAGNSCAAVADDDKLFFGAAGRKVEEEGGGGRSRLPLFLFLLSLPCALFSLSYTFHQTTLSSRATVQEGENTRGQVEEEEECWPARPPVGRSVGRRGIPLSISLLERGEWTGRRPSFLRPIDRRKEGGGPPPQLYSLSLLLLLRSFRPSSASVSVANAGREEGEDERERCAASVAHVI